MPKSKRYLIITSSGGGGHTNAAESRKKELLDLGIKENLIDIVDLMGEYTAESRRNDKNEKAKIKTLVAQGVTDYETKNKSWIPTYSALGLTPFFSGTENTKKWNDAQKEGTEEAVKKLETLVEVQFLAEAMQAGDVAKNLTAYLEKYDVEAIYNTQALSTPAICQAVVDYNTKNPHQAPLSILTTVTDLITHRADHFLSSLNKLSPAQAEILTMEISAAPLCDPGETEAEFYKKHGIKSGIFQAKGKLKLENGKIIRDPPPADNKYPSPVKQEYTEENNGKIKIKETKTENEYISKLLTISAQDNTIEFEKQPDDKLITITMGSQGSNSVMEYLEEFVKQAKSIKQDHKGNIYLCIAAGKNTPGSLYQKLLAKIKEIKGLPECVKILPLAFQDAQHMASLLNNSDILITRSGGMSSMEAAATNGRNLTRQVFVHSEAKLKSPDTFPKNSYDATYEALMPGTVKWEGGNAEYLLRSIGASLASPQTIDFKLESTEKAVNVKENSLFHLAYDKKLDESHQKTITKLIREGSNPNLKFAGGSYLIDHCKDFNTKLLLVQSGAKITPRSLEGLNPDQKNSLKTAERLYDPVNNQKPTENNSVIQKTALEQAVVGIDEVGSSIKKLLAIDAIGDYLDSIRLSLQTDPTEKRSPMKRLRQLRNFAFNTAIFIGKQPVNLITKPISMTTNLIKSALIGIEMLNNEAMGKKSSICNEYTLKKTANNALQDFTSTAMAAATVGFLIGGVSAPIALSIGGAASTISVGAINFGALTPLSSALGATVSGTVAAISSPTGSALLMAEGIAEWVFVRPALYYFVNPKKLFYAEDENNLNRIGQKIQALHIIVNDKTIDIARRREAKAEIDKLYNLELISKYGSPTLKRLVTPFTNQELIVKNNATQEQEKQKDKQLKSFEDFKNEYKTIYNNEANSALLAVIKNTNEHETPLSNNVKDWIHEIQQQSATGEEVAGGIYQGIGCKATFTEGKSLTIDEVYADSPAAELGLKQGSIITKVGDIDITNATDLNDVIAKIRAGAALTLSDGTVLNTSSPKLIDSNEQKTLEKSLEIATVIQEEHLSANTAVKVTVKTSSSTANTDSKTPDTSSPTSTNSKDTTQPINDNWFTKRLIRPVVGGVTFAVAAPGFLVAEITGYAIKSAVSLTLKLGVIPFHLINFTKYQYNKRINKIDKPESLNVTKELLENPIEKTTKETFAKIFNSKTNQASTQALNQVTLTDEKKEKSITAKDVLLDAIRMMRGLSYEERKGLHEKTGQKTVFPKLFS